ncbi:hypothetical protein LTR08_000425 [Meristemomyces frigidus]|nr:hypothetical protein LTR08_000425 [Meristemomyces frigidus]
MYRQGLCLLAASSNVLAAIVPAHAKGNASWPYQTFKTTNFTPPVLDITHHTDPSEGYLFFAPDGATEFEMAPLIMDMYGELVWNGPHTHAFAFGVQNYEGEDVLLWWNGTLYPEPYGRGNGVVNMYNKHYELLRKVSLPGDFLEQIPNATFPSNIDVHEIFLTEKGTILVTANNVTQADLTSVGGSANGWVVEAQFYEIEISSNKVLYAWKSLDHLDQLPFTASLYPLGSDGLTGATQSLAWGYFHINAVSPYDQGYLLSSRFLCSAVAIGPYGAVKWRLQGRDGGDFTLGDGADFCYQHDIRAFPEQPTSNTSYITLHMHDNHNSPIDNGTVPSSGKSLTLHLDTKHATLNHRYLNASGPVYSTAQGNYQPLPNGNVFIGHGWIPIFEEFSPSGAILTTIQFGATESRPGGGFLSPQASTLSYRAFKQPWLACPQTKPAVIVEVDGHSATVYVSWNGATEVESWQVYGGNTTDLVDLRTVSKDGFETAVKLPTSVKYVQVKAKLRSRGHGREGCAHNVTSDVVVVAP